MKDIHAETGKPRLFLETFADHNAAMVALRDHTSTGRIPKILATGAVRRTIGQLNPFAEDWTTPTVLEGPERTFALASLRRLSVEGNNWFSDQAASMLLEAQLSESEGDVSLPGKQVGELAVQGALW